MQGIRIAELERYCHLFDPIRIQDQISETLKNTGLSRHQLGKLREYEEDLYPELSQKLFDTQKIDMKTEMLEFMDEFTRKPILNEYFKRTELKQQDEETIEKSISKGRSVTRELTKSPGDSKEPIATSRSITIEAANDLAGLK